MYGLEADTANGWAPYRSSLATSGYIPLTSITDSLFAVTADGEVGGEPRRDGRSQRRLHAVDDAPPRGHQVPGRLGVRCRRRQVQHGPVHLLAAGRAGVDDDRERRGVGHGRDRQRARRAVGGLPGLLRGRVRLPDVGAVAAQPARHPAAQGGQPGLRRGAGGHPGRRRPGQAGRARCVHVRVVLARQREQLPGRSQPGLLARPQRHHRRGPALPRRHRGRRGRRRRRPHQRPARWRLRRDDDRQRGHDRRLPRQRRLQGRLVDAVRRHRLRHVERRPRARWTPKARTPPARCST